jgi:hypothetical protein
VSGCADGHRSSQRLRESAVHTFFLFPAGAGVGPGVGPGWVLGRPFGIQLAVASHIDFGVRKIVLFPTEVRQHWSLLVLCTSDLELYSTDSGRSKLFGHTDSDYGPPAIKQIEALVRSSSSPPISLGTLARAPARLKVTQQPNGVDCGFHVLFNAQSLAKHVDDGNTIGNTIDTWPSFGRSKGDELTGGEAEQEEKTREGQEVEKEQEEKAKKGHRTAGGERGRRRRSRQPRGKGAARSSSSAVRAASEAQQLALQFFGGEPSPWISDPPRTFSLLVDSLPSRW